MYGKKISDEVKLKISEALKGEKNPSYGKGGGLSPMFGRKHSPEVRAKISESKKGKRSPETLEKIKETKKRNKENKNKLICYGGEV